MHKYKIISMFFVACFILTSLSTIALADYSTDFSTSTGWVINGSQMSITGGHLAFSGVDRSTTELAVHSIDSTKKTSFNLTTYASTVDTSNTRIQMGIFKNQLTGTQQSDYTSDANFKCAITGYNSAITLDLLYNTTTFGSIAFTSSTVYHVSMGCYQASNLTYFIKGEIWTTGNYSNPLITALYWLNFIPNNWGYFCVGNHNVGTSVGSTIGYMDDLSVIPITSISSTNINVIQLATDPVWSGHTGEPTILTDGNQLDDWFSGGSSSMGDGTYTSLWYSYATNSTLSNWANPVKVLDNVRFGSVVRDGNTYYFFACKAPYSTTTSDVYEWTSTDKTTWTIANSGNPVLHHSTVSSSQWYSIWNVGVLDINHVFYLWAESATQSGTTNQVGVGLGFTYAAVSTNINFDTHRSTNAVIVGGGNPDAIYVPDRNGIILMYGLLTDGFWQIRSSVFYIGNDLNQSQNYYGTYNFYLGPSNEQTADPTIASTPNAKYGITLQWFHNQPTDSNLYQGYINMNLDQLFDTMANGTLPQNITIPTGLSVNQPNNNEIDISWNRVVSATGYNLYRSVNGGITYTLIHTSSIIGYVDYSVTINSTYYYKVNAYNNNGISLNSTIVSFTMTYIFVPTSNQTGLALIIIGCGMIFVGVILKWNRKMNEK